MNVLLITFSFPPAGGVGVLRALSLAKYLPENGVRIDVLTARNAPAVVRDEGLLAQLPASVTVHRTWTLDLPFALRKGIKKLLARREGAKEPDASAAEPGKPNPLKTFVANLLLPDPQIGWLPFAGRAAARIVRQRAIDAVIITVPPFSSVMLAKQLRRQFPSLKIVLDFRDEWLNTTLQLVSLNSNPKARLVAERTEREAVEAASAVVAVTEAARNTISARYTGQPAGKFVSISNGYDGAVPTAAVTTPRAEGAPVTLTYLGSVYGSTEPSSFVEAVLGLPIHLRERLCIRFVGHFEKPVYRDTLLRLGDTVEVRGFMPQAEALRLLDATDYVLLLSHDPVNVSAKFYDYLRSAKPILAAVHPDGDVRRRLEETRGGQWADIADVNAVRTMLVAAIEQPPATHFVPDLDAIARYHRRPLAKQYAALLQGLVSPRAGL